MGRFVGYLDGGKTDVQGHQKAGIAQFSSGVLTTLSANSWKTSQRGAGANMSVDVAVGLGLLNNPAQTTQYQAWSDSVENVIVTAADASQPRVDSLVAYTLGVGTDTSNSNNPGKLIFAIIAGTPAGAPTAKSDTDIQTALGATAAFIRLAYIYVNTNAATITDAVITDARTSVTPLVPVGPTAIAPGAITLGYAESTTNFTSAATAPVQIPNLSAPVNIPAGGRRAKITISIETVFANAAANANIGLWDGPVGTGTLLNKAQTYLINSSDAKNVTFVTSKVFTAGSKTFNVSLHNPQGNNVTTEAAATYAASILVEAI